MFVYYFCIVTSPARDSGGARYCNQFVPKNLSSLQSVQCTLIGAYNIRQFVLTNHAQVFGVCVLPGWLMEQPSTKLQETRSRTHSERPARLRAKFAMYQLPLPCSVCSRTSSWYSSIQQGQLQMHRRRHRMRVSTLYRNIVNFMLCSLRDHSSQVGKTAIREILLSFPSPPHLPLFLPFPFPVYFPFPSLPSFFPFLLCSRCSLKFCCGSGAPFLWHRESWKCIWCIFV